VASSTNNNVRGDDSTQCRPTPPVGAEDGDDVIVIENGKWDF
jgi:hypothetical protein